jgi:hypothetical protein
VRGHDRFLQDKHATLFLPHMPDSVHSLVSAIAARSASRATSAGHRLAALLVEANVFPVLRARLEAALELLFPGLTRTTQVIRTANATAAADSALGWIGLSANGYTYRRDRGVTASKPRVHVLDSEFGAVLTSTRTNSKNFRLELRHLTEHMTSQWLRPYVNVNHDRTIPPIGLVLGTHIGTAEHDGETIYELHARVAGLHSRGSRELAKVGGLSIAFHERSHDNRHPAGL